LENIKEESRKPIKFFSAIWHAYSVCAWGQPFNLDRMDEKKLKDYLDVAEKFLQSLEV